MTSENTRELPDTVENAAATDYYGLDIMHALNERRIPRETFSTSQDMPTIVRSIESPDRPASITVNVNGSKSPEVVARETVEIIRRELEVRQ